MMFSCKVRRMQSTTPQAGSVLAIAGNGKKWSILDRLHSDLSPTLDSAGSCADSISRILRSAPVKVATSGTPDASGRPEECAPAARDIDGSDDRYVAAERSHGKQP